MASTLITGPNARAFTRNPIWVVIESDLFTGSPGAYVPDEDNLSCRLEIWRDTDGGEEMLERLMAPYSTLDKRVTFDISGALRRDSTSIPSAASIGISPGDPYYDEAEGVTDVYRIRHADQYGSPVAAETLTVEGDYLAINGGLPADAIQDINWAGGAIGLHSYNYRRDSAFVFLKPVGRMQPDWIYLVALVTDDFRVTVTIRYDDGTVDFYDALEMELEEDLAYWLQSGYAQLKIDDHADVGKTVVGYNVSIIRVTGEQNTFTAFYIIDEMCPSWEHHLLMSNGMGGYESVRMKGITRHGHEVVHETFQRIRWNDFSISDGEYKTLRTQGSPTFNMHTGHYPAYYLEHLRQLLHAAIWTIDMDLVLLGQYRFKRLRVLSTNLGDFRSSVPGADGIALNTRHAWDDDGFNIY
jgi:hypothetical protein